MPTYAELETEAVYRNELVGPALSAFGVRCRNHFGVGADAFGTKGNNLHLTGRHRSPEWVRLSRFCTRRNYGTTDPRDTRGNQRLIRAFDLSLPRTVLFDVSRNLDAACRDGRAYMLAEYYGDMGDDSVVDGWFEGHDSTSDNSHKTHAHGGLWTIYADDAGALGDLFDIMIGTPTKEDDMLMLAKDPKTGQHWLCDGMRRRPVKTEDIVHLKYLGQTGALNLWTGTPAEAPGSIWQGVGDLMGLPVDAAVVDHDKLASLIVAKLPPTALTAADVRTALADVLLHGATPE